MESVGLHTLQEKELISHPFGVLYTTLYISSFSVLHIAHLKGGHYIQLLPALVFTVQEHVIAARAEPNGFCLGHLCQSAYMWFNWTYAKCALMHCDISASCTCGD